MNKSIHALVVTALVCLGVSGCKPAAKDAGSDTTAIQAKALPESATKSAAPTMAPVESTTAPAIAAAPQAKPKVQAPIKEAVAPKATGGPPAQTDAAKAEAARADSIRQAQERAEAMRTARLDSVKRAETAKAAVKTEPSVARAEEALPGGTDLAAQGKVPYQENCRKCHGVIGVPPKTMKAKYPKIATFDAEFMTKHSADSIVTVLTNGKNDDMKSFKDKLSHSEMVAVAAYIRSFAR
jgi:mono/diheme cytochrome c family protein